MLSHTFPFNICIYSNYFLLLLITFFTFMIKLASDTIDYSDIVALSDWLLSHPRLTQGEKVKEFEAAFAAKMGTEYAVMVNSGSSANLLTIQALLSSDYLKKGDKVILPAVCWATDIAPVIQLGLEPVICDINLNNLAICTEELEMALKKHNPKVMILVSVLGLPPDMEDIAYLCKKYSCRLILDNCESLGSRYDGHLLESYAYASTMSLYFGHHLSVTKNTPIPYLNESGIFKISTIEEIYSKYYKCPESINIMTFDKNNNVSYKSPSRIIKHKNTEDIIELTLEGNKKVSITRSHSVFGIDDKNNIIPKAGYELSVGDLVVNPKKIPSPKIINEINILDSIKHKKDLIFCINYNREDLNFKTKWRSKLNRQKENWRSRKVLPIEYLKSVPEDLRIAIKNSPKNKYIPYKIDVSVELCRLIGYYIAEGSYTEGGLCFSFHKKEDEYINDIKHILNGVFYQSKTRVRTVKNSKDILIDNTTLKLVFRDVFGITDRDRTKRVPDVIWHSSDECKINFLHAYFCGDGSKDKQRIFVSSANLDLINDISYMCLMLGIRGSIRNQVKKGAESILNGKKIIANGIWSFSIHNCILNENGFFIKDKKKTSGVSPKRDLLNNDLTLSKILKIKIIPKSDVDVYDFSVDSTENFIGGLQPICLHNSTIEGGMVFTNDKAFYNVLKMNRSHGWNRDCCPEIKQGLNEFHGIGDFESFYTFYHEGFNLRSTEPNAFLGLRQLDKMDLFIKKREQNFATYQRDIKNILWKPEIPKENLVSNLGYPVIVKNREKIARAMAKAGIECRPLISGNITRHPAYAAYYSDKFKNADFVHDNGMYLPNHPFLSQEDLYDVCKIFNDNN